MRELTKLDQAISQPKSLKELQALFNATLPAGLQNTGVAEGPCYCSTSAKFVIYYLADKAAAEKIDAMNDKIGVGMSGKPNPGCIGLTEANATSCLESILSLNGNYFGLLTSDDGASHACCFASYGLVSPSRTWGFYQSNAGDPKFTISPSTNGALGMPDGNKLAMNKEAFRAFFPTLTSGNVPVFGSQIKNWVLKVVSFEGKELYP